jgi:tRNA pseudouridine55 synthase
MKHSPISNPLSGVLLVDKGQDMTSHDVVAVTRCHLNTPKVGHCGTLDPMATGLLIVVVGQATKIQDLLMAEEKEYDGTLTLGRVTTTQDAEGETLAEKPVPTLSEEQIRAAFDQFKGDFYQLPPMVSAIKKDGVPLYKLARQGKEIEREKRFVSVYRYQIREISLPHIHFTVVCSKGFYVRTYAHDIGDVLGCGAHLSALRRTRSGKFDLTRTVTFDQLKNGDPEQTRATMLSLPEVSRLRGV